MKIIITENDKRRILSKHYGETNQELFEYLEKVFNISSNLIYHNLTQGRSEMIDFDGKYKDLDGVEVDENFRFNNNKKELKNKIVQFLKYDPKIYFILQIGSINKLMKLLKSTELDSERKFYTNELSNQMDIHRNEIEPKLNTTVKKFIDFYVK